MAATPFPSFTELKTELNRREHYYKSHLMAPMVDAFRAALEARNAAYGAQAKRDALGKEIFSICVLATVASLLPIVGTGAMYGLSYMYVGARVMRSGPLPKSLLRPLVQRRASFYVKLGRYAPKAADRNGTTAGLLWGTVSSAAVSDSLGYGKYFARANIATPAASDMTSYTDPATGEDADPRFYESDFSMFINNQFTQLARLVDALGQDPEMTEAIAAGISEQIRKRPLFTENININRKDMANRFEFLFYMADLLDGDKLKVYRQTMDDHSYPMLMSSNPITAMPSASDYPKPGIREATRDSITYTGISRTDPGTAVTDRINTLYGNLKSGSGEFMNSRYILNDVTPEVMVKAEAAMLEMIDATSERGGL